MKKIKLLKFLSVIFAFFAFNCSASIFDSESRLDSRLMDNVDWAYASNIWFLNVNPESIYRGQNVAPLVVVKSSGETSNVLPDELVARRSTAAFFASLVIQLSIDIFVQSNVGMNSYKNLLMGMDTTLTAKNDLLNEMAVESDLTSLLNETQADFGIKAVEEIDVSEVPVPKGVWLFLTAFLGGIGFGKRLKFS